MATASNNLEIKGEVQQVLPNGLFMVKLENDVVIRAHVSGKIRLHYIRILKGDHVLVAISPYDLEKGRIIFRYK